MSVCGQSGPTEEDSASEEVGATVREKLDIYKQKPVSKVVRVLTVLAYLLSVSLVAILLSIYYTCVWKSPELPPEPSAMGARHAHFGEDLNVNNTEVRDKLNITGGGNSTVNSSDIHSTSSHTTDSTNMNVSESMAGLIIDTTMLPVTSERPAKETSDGIIAITSKTMSKDKIT